MATGIIAVGAAQQELDSSPTRCSSSPRRRSSSSRCSASPVSSATRSARQRPDQPRQGLLVPHDRRRAQRARRRRGNHPRVVGPRLGAVVRRRRPVARAPLHHAARRRPRATPSPGSARHQRHLVPAHRLDRIGRGARRAAARHRNDRANCSPSRSSPRSPSASCSTSSS